MSSRKETDLFEVRNNTPYGSDRRKNA